MQSRILIFLVIWLSAKLSAQTKNLVVEGTDDQIGVIHTTSSGNSYSGLDFLRVSEFSGTDWRMVNEGGLFKLKTALDNFETSGTDNLLMSASGRLQLLEGSEASIGDDSGVLMLGKSDGPNLAMDQNEILAREGGRAADLYLQAGNPAGDTYLNIASGDVGIGSLTPKVQLGIEDSDFQIRVANSQQLANEWFIGASHSDWRSGGDQLLISPTQNSEDAMISLDKSNNTINAEGHRITQVSDPTNDLDAVNLRTLKTYSFPTFLSSGPINTFAECASRCQGLVQATFDDWRVPNVHELTQFIGTSSSSLVWTSDVQSDYAYFKDLNPNATTLDYEVYHIVFSLFSGRPLLVNYNSTAECKCVR